MAEERKRELVLPPGTFAYVLDGTKGQVKMYVGPTSITQAGQDRPVRYNEKTHRFDDCSLEESMRQSVVVPEGFYTVLTNPAKGVQGKQIQFPEVGTTISQTPDLLIGEKVNLPGPVNFSLFPGQTAEIRRGHHLRSNEFLRIKVYNEEKAKDNWTKAIIKKVEGAKVEGATTAPEAKLPETVQVATRQPPQDITVGKQYNILGTEVSFYIPPTGVSVVPDGQDEVGKEIFVRAAETLEQLEYAILVDEDGNKEYPKGPSVVFPRPTQRFLTADTKVSGQIITMRKFRAIEMNELQGIQLKFIQKVSLIFADGSKHDFAAGEEVFITGKEMPIYYPEEGHQLVKYDGKSLHYAVAIPKGEARYVMNRKNGEIRTEIGPKMLLPNPVTEIIVRRALSDGESVTWFPGPDGIGSQDALEYNRMLRAESLKEPTTRQGVVSEGRVEQQGGAPAVFLGAASGAGVPTGFDALEAAAASYAVNNAERGGTPRRQQAKSTVMSESRQGKAQEAMVGDVAERKSTFNEPRTLTFANKYKGVPTIKIQPGYAVQVADFDGTRKVEPGPKTVLLGFDQTLDKLTLSTGKPKTTDKLYNTAYLNVYNNKITDVIEVETIDHVVVSTKLAYNVSFEGDSSKWFSVENYVKHLCDHVRSVLKGRVRRLRIEEFYTGSTDMIRDIILGSPKADDKGGAVTSPKRPGMFFEENGMRVTDVEVLKVSIVDERIGTMLAQAQHEVVQQNITLSQQKKRLEVTVQTEEINRSLEAAKIETTKAKLGFDADVLALTLKNDLTKLQAEQQRQTENKKVAEAQQATNDLIHQSTLARQASELEQNEKFAKEEQDRNIEMLKTQAQAIIDQMKSVDPALVAALESRGARETLMEVAKSLSFHQMFGAGNAAEFVQKVFAGSPLAGMIEKVMAKAAPALAPGNGAASART